MNFIKKFFKHDEIIIGLCGLKKKTLPAYNEVPLKYKKTYIPNINYELF